MPEAQAEKSPLLLEIKDKVVRAHKRGVIPAADWKALEPLLPPDDLRPFDMSDLPEDIARQFTETDGTRGRIVYISPTEMRLVDDAHYLFRWADSYRETKLPDGSSVRGSAPSAIFSIAVARSIRWIRPR